MLEEKIKLDIGCGKNKMKGYVGVDIDPKSDAGVIAPAWGLPFPDAGVDEIVSAHVFEHFTPEETEKAFKEFYRVLKPGGRVFLKIDRDWTKSRLLKKDPTHRYRYTADEIKKLAKIFSRVKAENKIYRIGFRFYNKILAELEKPES